jgi:hypothetical protein
MLEGVHWAPLVTAARWLRIFYKLSHASQKRKQNNCFTAVNCFSPNKKKSEWWVIFVSPPNSSGPQDIGRKYNIQTSNLGCIWRGESQVICDSELPEAFIWGTEPQLPLDNGQWSELMCKDLEWTSWEKDWYRSHQLVKENPGIYNYCHAWLCSEMYGSSLYYKLYQKDSQQPFLQWTQHIATLNTVVRVWMFVLSPKFICSDSNPGWW